MLLQSSDTTVIFFYSFYCQKDLITESIDYLIMTFIDNFTKMDELLAEIRDTLKLQYTADHPDIASTGLHSFQYERNADLISVNGELTLPAGVLIPKATPATVVINPDTYGDTKLAITSVSYTIRDRVVAGFWTVPANDWGFRIRKVGGSIIIPKGIPEFIREADQWLFTFISGVKDTVDTYNAFGSGDKFQLEMFKAHAMYQLDVHWEFKFRILGKDVIL